MYSCCKAVTAELVVRIIYLADNLVWLFGRQGELYKQINILEMKSEATFHICFKT